jgi:YHS domain-containing protein
MLTRVLLFGLLLILLARALRSLLVGIIAGAAPQAPARGPRVGEHMVRDPVCGTFVLPSRAVTDGRGDHTHYFCSEQCRTTYRHQPKADSALRS